MPFSLILLSCKLISFISRFLKSEFDKIIVPSSFILQWDKFIDIIFELCSMPVEILRIPSSPNDLLFDKFIIWIFLLDNKISLNA